MPIFLIDGGKYLSKELPARESYQSLLFGLVLITLFVRHKHCRCDRLQQRLQHIIVVGPVLTRQPLAPLTPANDHLIERWYDHNKTVIQSPGPIGIKGNILQCAVRIVPPEQAVMVRGVTVRIRPLRQADHRIDGLAGNTHKLPG